MSVRHALLALLHEGPSYGLALKQSFEARTGSVWGLNAGQVYTTLGRLERDGLIGADSDDEDASQRRYRLLPAGAEELAAWFRSPTADGDPPRDELVIKLLMALAVSSVDVTDVIQTHRRRLLETMQRYTRLKADAEDDLGFVAVADSLILRAEADIHWLDLLDARIGSGASMTAPSPAAAPSSARRWVRS